MPANDDVEVTILTSRIVRRRALLAIRRTEMTLLFFQRSLQLLRETRILAGETRRSVAVLRDRIQRLNVD